MPIRKRAKKKDKLPIAALGAELTAAVAGVEADGDASLLVFETNRKRFAIGIEHTEGVVDCPGVSPLPSAPDGIIGVASVRGRMTLVMDLGGGANQQGLQGSKRRLILLRGEAQIGLLADRVEGVSAAGPGKMIKPRAGGRQPAEETGWPVRAFFKSEQGRVPVVDVERLAED